MTASELLVSASSAPDAAGRIRVCLQAGAATHEFHFQSKDIRLVPNNEALLAGALPLGMLWRRDLRLHGSVSKGFLEGLDKVGDIFHSWRPELAKIGVQGPAPLTRAPAANGGTGLFFSATVDESYSLVKHQAEITHLILACRPSLAPGDLSSAGPISTLVRTTASRLGMQVIEVTTNLRGLLVGQGLNWGQMAASAFRASVAHLLFPELRRLYVASQDTFAVLDPRATHPLLEPLWSTEGLEFVSDGGEASYIEKLMCLAEHDWALGAMHCCSQRPAKARNCGRCESCLRTMLGLLAIGALERCPTFEIGLEVRRIAGLRLTNRRAFTIAAENLVALKAGKHPREIVHALEQAIGRSKQRVLTRVLLRDAWPAGYDLMRRLARKARARNRGRLRTAQA